MLANMDEQYKSRISEKINAYIQKDEWKQAKSTLEKELKKYPDEYWLKTMLSVIYYELRDYQKSLLLSEQAYHDNPLDYLVLNNYACVLSVISGKEKEAIKLLNEIIQSDINTIAYGEYGEGIKWAKSIVNDSRVRLALVYNSIAKNDQAIKLLREHLIHRERGVYSDFSKNEILKRVKILEM